MDQKDSLVWFKVGPDRYIALPALSVDISQLQIYWYPYICTPICAYVKIVSEAEKNSWISDLTLWSYRVCPAEGGQLFNK